MVLLWLIILSLFRPITSSLCSLLPFFLSNFSSLLLFFSLLFCLIQLVVFINCSTRLNSSGWCICKRKCICASHAFSIQIMLANWSENVYKSTICAKIKGTDTWVAEYALCSLLLRAAPMMHSSLFFPPFITFFFILAFCFILYCNVMNVCCTHSLCGSH